MVVIHLDDVVMCAPQRLREVLHFIQVYRKIPKAFCRSINILLFFESLHA